MLRTGWLRFNVVLSVNLDIMNEGHIYRSTLNTSHSIGRNGGIDLDRLNIQKELTSACMRNLFCRAHGPYTLPSRLGPRREYEVRWVTHRTA
jgi:hypothetical protein